MNLEKLFGMMEGYAEAKSEMIDKTYNNIKSKANNGNKNAQTILKQGNKKEVRSMINQALNQ